MWDNHHWLLFGVVGTVGEFCSHGAMEDNWCMLLHLCYTSPFCHDHQTRECCCLPQPSHSLLPRSLNAIIGDADKDESRHMTHKPLTFTLSLHSLLDNHLGETLCATHLLIWPSTSAYSGYAAVRTGHAGPGMRVGSIPGSGERSLRTVQLWLAAPPTLSTMILRVLDIAAAVALVYFAVKLVHSRKRRLPLPPGPPGASRYPLHPKDITDRSHRSGHLWKPVWSPEVARMDGLCCMES
jgi:hypothetical protein